jgi:RNA polymerase sigma-70 factor (ECF subfamily)
LTADRPSPLSFESIALTHLDAAYNLARWLARDAVLAQDIVQDAMVRGLKYFSGFRGDNPRAWLLQIVRNVAMGRLGERSSELSLETKLESVSDDAPSFHADPLQAPDAVMEQAQTRATIDQLLQALPVELRECIVLRELEELPYKEIARIIDAPIGTVMSRLWRARQLLAREAQTMENSL